MIAVHGAQVGNDAVDQLTKFNQRLADLARTATPHTIDGLLVTKADTVDDKVSCFALHPHNEPHSKVPDAMLPS